MILCLIPMVLFTQTKGKPFGVTTLIENRKFNTVDGGLSIHENEKISRIWYDDIIVSTRYSGIY